MSSFRRKFTVKRKSGGSYNTSGFFESTGADTTLEIEASIQPATGSDMKLLPENRREEETTKLYTDTRLIGIIRGSGMNPDIIIIDGDDYEVVSVYPWSNGVIDHYKVLASKRVTNDELPAIGV